MAAIFFLRWILAWLSFFSSEHVQRLWSHVGISPLSEIPTYLVGLNPLRLLREAAAAWMVQNWSGHHGCSWLFSGWSVASSRVMQVSITQ